jgi:hypothetical protein
MPQVGQILTWPYPAYLPLALVTQIQKRYMQSCVQNNY